MEIQLDHSELRDIMTILEFMENEQRATELLQELHSSTRELGKLILNQDPDLSHQEWEDRCKKVKERVDLVIKEIRGIQ